MVLSLYVLLKRWNSTPVILLLTEGCQELLGHSNFYMMIGR